MFTLRTTAVVVLALALAVTTVGAVQAAVVPTNVHGNELWLDAADMSTLFTDAAMTTNVSSAGDTVRGWADKSGNGNHATTTDATPSYQTGVISGKDVVRFNRGDMGISGGLNVAANQDRTAFVVMNYTTQTQNNEIFGTSTGNMVDVGNFNNPYRLRIRQGSNLYSANNTVPSGANLLEVRGDASGTKAARNGATIIDSTDKRFHWAMNPNMYVGGANFGGREYIGDLAEVVIFDRALTAAETNDVGYALQEKYSLSGQYTAPPELTIQGGLKLWLDAGDASTVDLSGSEVTQWRDKSGQGNHANAGGTKRPTLTLDAIGGRAALDFDRDQLTVNDLGIAAGQERTVFMVMDYDTLTNNSEMFGTSTGNMIDVGDFFQSERLRLRDSQSNGGTGGDDGFAGIYSGDGSLPLGTHMLTVQGLASDTVAWAEGTEILNRSGNFFHYDLTGNVGVGGAFLNGREYIGQLAEVLVYDRALNPLELHVVGSYLGAKYGLQSNFVVPEPATLAIWTLLASLGIMLVSRRRRRIR